MRGGRAIHRKIIVHPELKAAIKDRLKAAWSPEQIAGRMKLERHKVRVSHETIYRVAYSKDGSSIVTCAGIAVAAGHVVIVGTTGPTSSTSKAYRK